VVLFGNVRQIQEVREGASQRDGRVNRQLAKFGGQRLEVAIGSGPRGLGHRPDAFDGLEEPRPFMFAQRLTQEFSQESNILSQWFVRIGLHLGPDDQHRRGWHQA
jgi:hypothetical protein